LGNSADWGYQVRSLVDAEYLARCIPDAELIVLPGISHFAPLQRPYLFNHSMLAFLNGEHERGDASTAGQ
jgi:pimeloyl-ACP methyl ester carboxylesterase